MVEILLTEVVILKLFNKKQQKKLVGWYNTEYYFSFCQQLYGYK